VGRIGLNRDTESRRARPLASSIPLARDREGRLGLADAIQPLGVDDQGNPALAVSSSPASHVATDPSGRVEPRSSLGAVDHLLAPGVDQRP